MRTHLPLAVLLAVTVFSQGHALEAVAQSPVGGGSSIGASNLANDARWGNLSAKVESLQSLVASQQVTMQKISDCNADGKLWNGKTCVAVNGAAGAGGAAGSDGTGGGAAVSTTIPVCNSSLGVPYWDGKKWQCKTAYVRVAGNGSGENPVAECDSNEIRVGGGTSCGSMPNMLQSSFPINERAYKADCENGWSNKGATAYAICFSFR